MTDIRRSSEFGDSEAEAKRKAVDQRSIFMKVLVSQKNVSRL